jgi:hypothetical protein
MKKEAQAMEKGSSRIFQTAYMRKVRPRGRPGLSCRPLGQPGGKNILEAAGGHEKYVVQRLLISYELISRRELILAANFIT